jgi:hypothetical protein
VLGALTPTAIPAWLGLRPASCLRMVAMRYIDDGEPGPVLPMLRQGGAQQTPAELGRRATTRHRAFFVIPGGRGI